MSFRTDVIKIVLEIISGGKKITGLPSASNPVGSELIECVQGGVNKKLSVSQIALGGSTIAWGGFITSPPTLPLSVDTQYVASADFDFNGVEIFKDSILFGPAGASTVDDFLIKP